ncbi:MAG: DNA cytosine methyltransferase [Proteobacteria bacterium]|nr:DNA cytosine methyltransferase [Pseudomonadota bacterium]
MPEFVSLFSGAGGLDLGLERAGWRCLFSCDHDSAAFNTLRVNQLAGTAFEGTSIRQADIAKLSGAEVLEAAKRKRGEIELLAGGPPCQSWSSAGLQLGFADPRGQLVEHYVRLAKELQTKLILFENVRGLLTARGPSGRPGEALEIIRRRLLNDAGYETQVKLLNAADFGVPQRRVRLILLGHRAGEAPTYPAPTHSALPMPGAGRRPWISLGRCISDLTPPKEDEIERPGPKLTEELKSIQPGSGVKSPGKRETTRPGGHWGYKQGAFVADPGRPARTVTANSQQDWIRDPVLGLRKLTIRETARIQSFIAKWQFVGSRSDKRRLIGNAVPPLLAEKIGRHLIAWLLVNSKNLRPQSKKDRKIELLPLPIELAAAIQYTLKEERRNGQSRRSAQVKRVNAVG